MIGAGQCDVTLAACCQGLLADMAQKGRAVNGLHQLVAPLHAAGSARRQQKYGGLAYHSKTLRELNAIIHAFLCHLGQIMVL